jgi:ABC-type sugar transport system permease subunit
MINEDKNLADSTRPDNNNNNKMLNNLMGYIDTRIDLIRLEAETKLKEGFMGLLHALVMGVSAFMALIFLNIFLGLLLNALLNSTFWGFGIITLFYIIIFLVFLFTADKNIFRGLADKTFDNTIYKSDKRS